MTQGEEHRHGAASGEFRRKLDLSHRSDLAGSTFHKSAGTTNSRSVAEVLLPPTSRSSIQQHQGGEDARNLLQFVNHASCDIKAVLDQGGYTYRHHAQLSPLEGSVGSDMVLKSNASPTRHFSPVDLTSHHLKRNTFPPHHGIPHHHHHHQHPGHEQRDRDEAPKPHDAQTTLQRRSESFPASNREKETRCWVENSSKAGDTVCRAESRKHSDTKVKSDSTDSEKHKEPRNLDLFRFVDMMRENAAKENGDNTHDHDHSEDEGSIGDEEIDFKKRKSREKNTSEANRDNKEKGISSVPLRKRRLPASFWQEPKGKSGNHRIQTQLNDRSVDGQPRSFVHHPGLSLFGQLKLPIPGPLSSSHFDFDLGLGRPFGAEKNPFLYPSTSSTAQFLNLNMPYRPGLPLPVPHGVDDHHRHGLAMPCGNSVCMCHLQTHLGGCHSAACEPPSPQNIHQGLFGRSPVLPPISPLDTSPSSSLALGRWSAMQSPDGMGDLLGGYHLPRVLKPIPTKSLTSYPPRFHPVFT